MDLNGKTASVIEQYKGEGYDWNAFAYSHPNVRFCHLWQYAKVVEDTYGYEACGFIVKQGDQILAVCPAVLANSFLFGRKLVSQPFSEYGGILSKGLSNGDYEGFFRYINAFCVEHGIAHLEMHGPLWVPDEIREKYVILANPYRYAVLPLAPDPEVLRRKVFDYQIRKALNKAERSGVRSFEDSELDIIKEKFWPLFLRSMRRLGSPPHALAYFINLKHYFPAELKVFWAEVRGKLVCALMGFAIGKSIQITNIVSDERNWDARINDAVHWEFIKWGCENGYLEFDFGSVRYDGQLRYKKKWGAEIRNSGYHYVAPRREKITTFSSSSRIMRAFSKIWSSCVPIWASPVLGPLIRKQLVR